MAHSTYELRIQYSQNGRIISDTLFRTVSFFWSKQDEADAREAAFAIVRQNGSGSAAIYLCPTADNSIKTYLSTNMHYPSHVVPNLNLKSI